MFAQDPEIGGFFSFFLSFFFLLVREGGGMVVRKGDTLLHTYLHKCMLKVTTRHVTASHPLLVLGTLP